MAGKPVTLVAGGNEQMAAATGTPPGYNPGVQQDPWKAAYDATAGLAVNTPGYYSGGSAGNGASVSAQLAANQKAQGVAAGNYKNQGADLKNLYAQYGQAATNAVNADKQAYALAQTQANTAGNQISKNRVAATKQQDAKTQAALAALGISGPSSQQTLTDQGADYENAQLAGQNASWSNLTGALGAAQQVQDRATGTGIQGQGILAQQSLTQAYNLYLQQLLTQAQQIQASYVAPTAGTYHAGSSSNKAWDTITDAYVKNMISGITKGSGPSADDLAGASQQIQDYVKGGGKVSGSTQALGISPSVWATLYG